MAESEPVSGEPYSKRRKFSGTDSIFKSFLTKKDKRYQLEQAWLNLKRGINVNIATLRIEDCNARSSENFGKATVKVSPIKWKEDGDGIKGSPVGDIFVDGLNVLEHYLDKTKPQIPTDTKKQHALLMLLRFLSEDHAVLFEERNREEQVVIAQHLLSKLAVNSNYTVSSPEFPSQHETLCPCVDKDQLIGNIGDCSYGCKDGWHGSSDIIMGDSLPVSVFNSVDGNDSSISSVEMKTDEDFLQKDVHQIIAQTVVFSFLQRKINKGQFKKSLVPGIGISGSKLVFYFYDAGNDVLLASKPIKLVEANTLLTCPVVFLWLTLNYQIFCTGITDQMKMYKAEFFKRVDKHLRIYVNNVERPMYVPHTSAESLYPWTQETREPENIEGSHIEYTTIDS